MMIKGPIPVPGHEGYYSISRDGGVRSCSSGQVIQARHVGTSCTISLRSRSKTLSARRLVVSSFRRVEVTVVNRPTGEQVIEVKDAGAFSCSNSVAMVSVNGSTHLDSIVFVTQSDLQRHLRQKKREFRVIGAAGASLLQARQDDGFWETIFSAKPASDCEKPWERLDKLCRLHGQLKKKRD